MLSCVFSNVDRFESFIIQYGSTAKKDVHQIGKLIVFKQQIIGNFFKDNYTFREVKEDVLCLLLVLFALLSLEEQHGDGLRLLVIKQLHDRNKSYGNP